MWQNVDGSIKDEITENQYNKPRWIDTPAMICNSLTKFGNEAFAARF